MIKTITLETLAESSESEVFNFVAHHLLTQFHQSAGEDLDCRYRAQGRACAAGCLMSPEEYDKGFEGFPWGELVDDKKVPDAHMQLVTELQWVHDDPNARGRPGVWLELIPGLAEEWEIELEPEVKALLKLRSGN
jgi:hypothetical protein